MKKLTLFLMLICSNVSIAQTAKISKVIVDVQISIEALDFVKRNTEGIREDTIHFQDIFTVQGKISDPQISIWNEIIDSSSKEITTEESTGGCMCYCNSAKIFFITDKEDTISLDYEDCNHKKFIMKNHKKYYLIKPSKNGLSLLEKQMKHIFRLVIRRIGSEKL